MYIHVNHISGYVRPFLAIYMKTDLLESNKGKCHRVYLHHFSLVFLTLLISPKSNPPVFDHEKLSSDSRGVAGLMNEAEEDGQVERERERESPGDVKSFTRKVLHLPTYPRFRFLFFHGDFNLVTSHPNGQMVGFVGDAVADTVDDFREKGANAMQLMTLRYDKPQLLGFQFGCFFQHCWLSLSPA